VIKNQMSNKHLHIVTLDTPWPVNYGGVIDLFYKIKALYEQGVQIHLHCFCKDDKPQTELNKFCVEVNYYSRNTGLKNFSFSIPYIVNSRNSEALLQNLKNDNYPILLEGIHCTYHLFKNNLPNRKIIVRLHNVEFEYYKHLAKNEPNILKRCYYLHESRLLKKYEKAIANKAKFLAVSEYDVQLYKNEFNAQDIQFLPVFIPQHLAVYNNNVGSYCLYHGNLSINENEKAATWLLKKVFANIDFPLVVAGKNPSKKLVKLAHAKASTCIIQNPINTDMKDLLTKAQINILPSFNNTGVKLKLINALQTGKHCIVNLVAVQGSGLEDLCHIANNAAAIQQKINLLFKTPVSEQEVNARNTLFEKLYNNAINAKKIIDLLY
jgi:hypothetical protein